MVPRQPVTAWLAMSDAGAEAGCMEVAASQGRPRQMQHAALRLEHSINGAGQAIVAQFFDGSGEMMQLAAGQFSLHHTLCAHRSPPNRADHRRLQLRISYIPPRFHLTSSVRICAKLARARY